MYNNTLQQYTIILIRRFVYLWEHKDIETVIDFIKNYKHNLTICVNLKMVNSFFGQQRGFTMYSRYMNAGQPSSRKMLKPEVAHTQDSESWSAKYCR